MPGIWGRCRSGCVNFFSVPRQMALPGRLSSGRLASHRKFCFRLAVNALFLPLSSFICDLVDECRRNGLGPQKTPHIPLARTIFFPSIQEKFDRGSHPGNRSAASRLCMVLRRHSTAQRDRLQAECAVRLSSRGIFSLHERCNTA